MSWQEAQKVVTLDREAMVRAGISTGCTAGPGRRCKVITSEFSTLQGVINALILADQYVSALGTESKSVFCISKRLSAGCQISVWLVSAEPCLK